MTFMNIGQAATAAGVTPKMIRHYESLGLMPEASRTDAGYRLYGEREVALLRFIRQSRGLGFSMKQIEALVALWRNDQRQSREVKAVAQAQLAELDARQRELDEMRATLSHWVADCAGDGHAHCAILEQLAGGATPPAPAARPGRNLKQVHAGDKVAPRPAKRPSAAAAAPAHAGLVAWSRAIATPSAMVA